MIWIRLNKFEIFNQFRMMKITLKPVLIFFLRTCKTVSREPFINREIMIRISQFCFTAIVVTRKMRFLSVVTPSAIYKIELARL